MRNVEGKTFLLLLALTSPALLAVLWQLGGAILRGTVQAILFSPVSPALGASFARPEPLATATEQYYWSGVRDNRMACSSGCIFKQLPHALR